MVNLWIRVAYAYTELKEWYDNINCNKKFVYEHSADSGCNRTHCHILLIGCDIKPDALKTRFQKLYKPEIKGNSLWCWKTAETEYKDYIHCISYGSKGKYDPLHSEGFTEEELSTYKSLGYDEDDKKSITEVKLENGKLVKQVPDKGTLTKRQMLEQMRSRLTPESGIREICKVVRKVLMENNQVIGQYKMMDYVDSIMMYDQKDNWIGAMELMYNKRYGL